VRSSSVAEIVNVSPLSARFTTTTASGQHTRPSCRPGGSTHFPLRQVVRLLGNLFVICIPGKSCTTTTTAAATVATAAASLATTLPVAHLQISTSCTGCTDCMGKGRVDF
jgi:hypothetical protein